MDILSHIDVVPLDDLELLRKPDKKEHRVLSHLNHGRDGGRRRAGEEGGVVGAGRGA